MSSDFVELLRDDFSAELKDSDPHTVINAYEEERHQAADRIEALEKALRTIVDGPRDANKSYAELFVEVCIDARAALEGKDD